MARVDLAGQDAGAEDRGELPVDRRRNTVINRLTGIVRHHVTSVDEQGRVSYVRNGQVRTCPGRADVRNRGGLMPDYSDRPLEALRWHWGSAYMIVSPELDVWIAVRRDTRETLRADTPLGLREKIIADYGARKVPRGVDGARATVPSD
jgi:hypothetical protein